MVIIGNTVFQDVWLDALCEVRQELGDSLARIRRSFAWKTRVMVFAFNNVQEIADYLGFAIPGWIRGTGYGDRILVVGREGWTHGFDDSIFEIILHEFTHLAVAESFAVKCPLWLNEGLAIFCSGGYKSMDFSGCRPDYPCYERDYEDGDVFYRQSAYVVKRLVEKQGEDWFVGYCRRCRDFINDSLVGAKAIRLMIGD